MTFIQHLHLAGRCGRLVGLALFIGGLGWTASAYASDNHQSSQRSPVASRAGIRDTGRASDLPPTINTDPPCPQVIWDNGPFNNVDGLASEENTAIPSARTADDFVLTSSATIGTITFDIYVTPSLSVTGAVDIYADSGGSGPVNALPLATYTSTTFTIVGSGFGLDIRRYTVTLSPPLTLAAGRYWVSGYVIGTGSGRGFFATSNGAPSPSEPGYFRSAFFGFPNWGFAPIGPHFAFTVCGESRANVNNQVQLLIYPTAHAALFGCPGYATRLILGGQLTNTGMNTLSDITIQVRRLGFPDYSNPNNVIVATPNPHRLASADDFTACATGGLAGALQTTLNGKTPIGSNVPIPTLNPGQSTPLFFRIHCPTPQPVRFLVDVLARVEPVELMEAGDTSVERQKPPSALERQVIKTLTVEVRRGRQGQLVARIVGEQPSADLATAGKLTHQPTLAPRSRR